MNSVTCVPHVRYFATKCNSGNKQCQSNCHDCEHLTQCWNCHEFNDCNERFCHHCHKIQPVIELTDSSCNYYKMFSLPERYDIDTKVLLENYRSLQKKLHPDVYTNKSQKEKDVAAAVSSIVNLAYDKLKDPVKRAAYFYNLKTNVNVLSEDSNIAVPPMILMEMLELNESIDAAKGANELNKIMNETAEKFKQYETQFTNHMNNNDYESAKTDIIGMKYYDKAIKTINDKLVPSI